MVKILPSTLMLLAAFLVPHTVFCARTQKISCKKNPVYCHIIKLQPKANRQWAMKLSNHLVKYAKKHQLDPWRSLAIGMQESSLNKTKRYNTVIVPVITCNDKKICHTTFKVIKAISDVGLFQLHARTVQHYKFDTNRLTHDIEYMVKTHFIVLIDKIKQCRKLGPHAWSCYHSRTPVLRKRYIKRVNQFYKKRSLT